MVSVRSGSRKAIASTVHLPWSCTRLRYAVVFGGLSRAHARGDATAAGAVGGSAMNTPISLAALLERFFTQRLMQQRQASPHTISSYRDTFHQFLKTALPGNPRFKCSKLLHSNRRLLHLIRGLISP